MQTNNIVPALSTSTVPTLRLIRTESPKTFGSQDTLFLFTDTREEVLEKIEELWKLENLFSLSVEGRNKLIANIVSYITYSHGRFLPIVEGDKHGFVNKLLLLSNHAHLNDEVKLFSLTIALELGLFGINVTPILGHINSQGITLTAEGNEKDNPRGPLQELLACWFLAKFVYKQDLNLIKNFEVDKMIKVTDKKEKALEHQPTRHKGKEVDVATPDAFVEVKDAYVDTTWSKHAFQVFSILSRVVDESFKEKIKKVILIKGSLEPTEFSPGSKESNGSVTRKNRIVGNILSSLETNDGFSLSEKEYLKKLEIDIYLIPLVKNQHHIRQWIKACYEALLESPQQI
ncbi:MAG: hypothetical protein HY094_05100 [Candidatus Melainabacteria bacterium]|nr:hypothetical protein [Candidatus Melainabacteria bacterium]